MHLFVAAHVLAVVWAYVMCNFPADLLAPRRLQQERLAAGGRDGRRGGPHVPRVAHGS